MLKSLITSIKKGVASLLELLSDFHLKLFSEENFRVHLKNSFLFLISLFSTHLPLSLPLWPSAATYQRATVLRSGKVWFAFP